MNIIMANKSEYIDRDEAFQIVIFAFRWLLVFHMPKLKLIIEFGGV